mgnify:CR=1 FL=1
MKYFKLPDLGEGLPEAEIVTWHVKVGDTVKTDQLMVEVETAKAIVEIPSPQDGVIMALFGEEGDMIHTGEPLVEFECDQNEDSGTVVGDLKQAESATVADHFIIGAAPSSQQALHAQATPAVRALAKHLNVDLAQISVEQGKNHISASDIEKAAELQITHGEAQVLKGVRRTMAKNMALSHSQVVPVTVVEDVDIDDWDTSESINTDLTMRLIHAISYACKQSPKLNAWFDGNTLSLRVLNKVNVGIAVDSDAGLFVPVLNDIGSRSLSDLRKGLNQMRADIKKRTIPPSQMQGATITLTNFGTIAGRYANPVVMPPQVAIIGCGVSREEVVARNGKMLIRKILPLSITFDHRAATGGEAARFMAALLEDLKNKAV